MWTVFIVRCDTVYNQAWRPEREQGDGRSFVFIFTHYYVLSWVSILRLLKCLNPSVYAKTDAWTFHPQPLTIERAGPDTHTLCWACSRRLLKYTSIRAQSLSIVALSWSMSAWAGGMRDRAPGWTALRATGQCRWPSRETRP